ncbi:hypothetical protein ScPMuIL_014087 [Solemya velum]
MAMSQSEDEYMSQLQDVFDSCDEGRTGSLGRNQLMELFQKLQLEEYTKDILPQLLRSEADRQVSFNEFKDVFVKLLCQIMADQDGSLPSRSNTPSPVISLDEASAVSPKLIMGNKRYGRRSKPLVLSDLASSSDMDTDSEIGKRPSQFRASKHSSQASTQVEKLSSLTSEHPVTEYLHNIDKYEAIYKSHQRASRRYCIPDGFSITKNLMSHCLGLPLGFPPGRQNFTSDIASVREYIANIDKEFTLVMIMEYFSESLVLLKRLLHWDLKDILYFKTNRGNYTYGENNRKENTENSAIHKHWSSVDYLLYDHFNKTFWEKVREQGSDFQKECEHFEMTQNTITGFCAKNFSSKNFIFPKTQFNKKFLVTPSDCQLMQAPLLRLMKKRFTEVEGLSVTSSPSEEGLPPPGLRRGC